MTEVVPPGSSFEDRHEDGLREMARSEKVAAAVALEQAGFKVKTTNKGALVEAVASDAPAASKLDAGDVIVAARGKPILTPGELRAAFTGVHPGDDVVLRVRRDGQARDGDRTTVESPSEKGRAIIGIRVAQAADIKLPVKVDINLGQVGGPSAGSSVRARRAPGARHQRRPGAARSSRRERWSSTARVGPIGGVKQKTYGARKAGADVFLVPAGENAAEARRYAGNLRIIPVVSFQQALSALRTLPSK